MSLKKEALEKEIVPEDISDEVVEMRKATGMNRREFSDYFGIPYRTIQDWEAGKRMIPEYLLRLMKYKLEIEKLYKKGISDERKDDKYGKNSDENPAGGDGRR